MWGFPVKSGLASHQRPRIIRDVHAELSLVLETSTRHGSAVLADSRGGQILASCAFESDRNHNAGMFGPLEAMLAGISSGEINHVIVGAGPGSYSGTRVGIAVAQGIAIARNCPAVAIPSLVGLANPAAASLAIGDARRGHWWWAPLRGRMLMTPAPELGDAGALQHAIDAASTAGHEIFTFENPDDFTSGAEIHKKSPDAASLWQAWLEATESQKSAWASLPPQPCYLKPPHITAPKRPWLQG